MKESNKGLRQNIRDENLLSIMSAREHLSETVLNKPKRDIKDMKEQPM